MNSIIGKKLGMTQVFDEDGNSIPVTTLQAGPCLVSQVKVPEKDGYSAVQVAYSPMREKLSNSPMTGHLAKAGLGPHRTLMEFAVENVSEYKPGQEIKVDIFEVGDKVMVTGVTKGRGFQGMVKRWGASGGDAGHGSKSQRAPGAIGQCATPARVWKLKKLPGHMGVRKQSVKNLIVMKVDTENNIIAVKGSVPGGRNGLVTIKKL
jgi:large subunit ribosomal protein L3